MTLKPLLALALVLIATGPLHAQHDSTYYSSYPHMVTGRVYFSNKYTFLTLRNSKENYRLRYQPNTSINAGVGATYQWATLNLAIGILNQDPSNRKTKYLDLQFHNYGRKFTVDLLGQFYRGFNLYPQGTASVDDHFYQRPDIFVNEVGGTFQYVLNYRHFSYRASSLQNEWQKKSAGSLLFGLSTYYGSVKADSTLVPTLVNKTAASRNLRMIKFFEFGPNLGYVYTWVIENHFFVTGSAVVSLGYGVNTIKSDRGKNNASGFSPNTMLRFCTGYNSDRWGISVVYVNNGVQGGTNHADDQMTLNTGNLRINFIGRFVFRSM